MGADIGITIVRGDVDPLEVAKVLPRVWTPDGDIRMLSGYGPLFRTETRLPGAATTRLVFATSGDPFEYDLAELARALAADQQRRVLAAFLFDHSGLGGFRLFDAGELVAELDLDEAHEPWSYVDGLWIGLQTMLGRPIALSEGERLFLTERVSSPAQLTDEQTEGHRDDLFPKLEWRVHRVADQGSWVVPPLPVETRVRDGFVVDAELDDWAPHDWATCMGAQDATEPFDGWASLAPVVG